ncbi:hypothetical protein [Flagellimonas sp.]|uniref:hypothetical protein n=1 Tax=Flagellimonas sp. TaxID=2058762 RepID=UPI003AB5C9D8
MCNPTGRGALNGTARAVPPFGTYAPRAPGLPGAVTVPLSFSGQKKYAGGRGGQARDKAVRDREKSRPLGM